MKTVESDQYGELVRVQIVGENKIGATVLITPEEAALLANRIFRTAQAVRDAIKEKECAA